MKNKPLLLALIYSVLYIGVTLYLYYFQKFDYFERLYLMGMAALVPFVVLTIKIQKDTVFAGVMSGKQAAKEGMKFVLYCVVILVGFQIAFYYGGWKDFKTELTPGSWRASIEKMPFPERQKWANDIVTKRMKIEEGSKLTISAIQKMPAEEKQKFLESALRSMSPADRSKTYEVPRQKMTEPERANLDVSLVQIEAVVQKCIAFDIANVTLFREVSGMIFRLVFVGIFTSFVAALFLRVKR